MGDPEQPAKKKKKPTGSPLALPSPPLASAIKDGPEVPNKGEPMRKAHTTCRLVIPNDSALGANKGPVVQKQVTPALVLTTPQVQRPPADTILPAIKSLASTKDRTTIADFLSEVSKPEALAVIDPISIMPAKSVPSSTLTPIEQPQLISQLPKA